MGTTHFALN
jgi:hypothetical protein